MNKRRVSISARDDANAVAENEFRKKKAKKSAAAEKATNNKYDFIRPCIVNCAVTSVQTFTDS